MKNLNIAVADDNDAVVCMLSSIIENDEDFNLVGTARNGAQTLEMIRDKEPDVVLLDMIMPKMDGLGVMEQVSRDTSLKKHPAFIIISAVGHESMTESAFGLGADYYLMKPFDNHALVRRLHDLWQAVNGNAPKHPYIPGYRERAGYQVHHPQSTTAGRGIHIQLRATWKMMLHA